MRCYLHWLSQSIKEVLVLGDFYNVFYSKNHTRQQISLQIRNLVEQDFLKIAEKFGVSRGAGRAVEVHHNAWGSVVDRSKKRPSAEDWWKSQFAQFRKISPFPFLTEQSVVDSLSMGSGVDSRNGVRLSVTWMMANAWCWRMSTRNEISCRVFIHCILPRD